MGGEGLNLSAINAPVIAAGGSLSASVEEGVGRPSTSKFNGTVQCQMPTLNYKISVINIITPPLNELQESRYPRGAMIIIIMIILRVSCLLAGRHWTG